MNGFGPHVLLLGSHGTKSIWNGLCEFYKGDLNIGNRDKKDTDET